MLALAASFAKSPPPLLGSIESERKVWLRISLISNYNPEEEWLALLATLAFYELLLLQHCNWILTLDGDEEPSDYICRYLQYHPAPKVYHRCTEKTVIKLSPAGWEPGILKIIYDPHGDGAFRCWSPLWCRRSAANAAGSSLEDF